MLKSLLVFWLTGLTAFAQTPQRYRVELLVLRNLQGVSDPGPQTTLRDFSNALDLLAPPTAAAEEKPEMDMAAGATAAIAPAAQLPNSEQALEAVEPEPEPEPLAVLVDAQSEIMQQAWQRLRSSRAYGPELYLSWEQTDAEPAPSIRLHDQVILREEDPWAGVRVSAQVSGADEIPTFTDTTTPAAELAAGGEVDAENEVAAKDPPEPIRFYRIDGTASLRKSRFLHLDLDIEFREPVGDNQIRALADPTADPQRREQPYPPAFRVTALRQSRQVQTREMEYFDGPVFAVLAMISRVETETEPDAPAGEAGE